MKHEEDFITQVWQTMEEQAKQEAELSNSDMESIFSESGKMNSVTSPISTETHNAPLPDGGSGGAAACHHLDGDRAVIGPQATRAGRDGGGEYHCYGQCQQHARHTRPAAHHGTDGL